MGGGAKLSALCLVLSGCSWVAMKRPPSDPTRVTERPDCTRSSVPPVLDLLSAVPIGLATGWLVAVEADERSYVDSNTASDAVFLATSAVTFGLFLASASSGFSNASACRELQAKFERRAAPFRPGAH